jgi:TPR repeat protein
MQMVSPRVVLVAILLLAVLPTHAQQPNPPLADIKAAAEAGNAQAQDQLGDAYRTRGDFENAVTWYRRSAPQGILNSEYQLANLLLTWARSALVPKATSATHVDEAVPWLLKAASRGHARAQLELGQLFQEGTYVKKDFSEAYKWFCLAADVASTDALINPGRSYRDNLILKMSQPEIAEGNRRVAEFLANPDKPAPMPEPSFLQHLKLQGIAGTPGYPLAIINGKTLAPNDSVTLKVDSRSVTVRCLSIAPTSATIAVDGSPSPKQLFLR